MGASSSKIDNPEAVALYCARSKCLSKAVGFQYAFSDAHIAYFRSLKSITESLNQFIDGIDTTCNVAGSVNPQFPSKKMDELDSKDNNVSSDVEEMVQEKNEGMLRIKCYNSLSTVSTAIRSQFDKASESAAELSEIIEVGKCQYHQKHSVDKSGLDVFCCIGFDVQAFVKSVIIAACSHLSSKNHLLMANDNVNAHSSLSCTLQMLISWEMKLYDEVMEKEKMRIAYGKKCKEMKRSIEESAEQQNPGPVMPVLKKLSMKIRLSVKQIDFMSATIRILRDEILCLHVCQLIKGLARTWSSMYDCYKTLHEAIPEENFLQSIFCGYKSSSDAQIETTKQLGFELIEWTINFSTWIKAQKDFIKALNDWLLMDAGYAKKETPDGVAPFSPSVFIICNQWDQTIQEVSEDEVITSMQSFASAVLSLWKKRKAEQRQKFLVNKDMEKQMKSMEKEEKEVHKIVKAQSKKLMHVSGQAGNITFEENIEESRLHVGLQQMFKSLENYCAANLTVYRELIMCIVEEENGISLLVPNIAYDQL